MRWTVERLGDRSAAPSSAGRATRRDSGRRPDAPAQRTSCARPAGRDDVVPSKTSAPRWAPRDRAGRGPIVDLPEPDSPTSAMTSRPADREADVVDRAHDRLAAAREALVAEVLGQPACLEDRRAGRRAFRRRPAVRPALRITGGGDLGDVVARRQVATHDRFERRHLRLARWPVRSDVAARVECAAGRRRAQVRHGPRDPADRTPRRRGPSPSAAARAYTGAAPSAAPRRPGRARRRGRRT